MKTIDNDRAHWLFWSLPLLAVLYILSLGPAYRFFSGPVLPALYGPLFQLEDRCKPLDRFITWYVEDVWGIGKW